MTVAYPAVWYTSAIGASKLLMRTSRNVRAVRFIGAVRTITNTVASISAPHTKTVATQKLSFGTGSRAVSFVRAITAVAISIASPLPWDARVGCEALELVHGTRFAVIQGFRESVGLSGSDNRGEDYRSAQEPHEKGGARAAHAASK